MPASNRLKIVSVGAAVAFALAGAGSATAATVAVGPGQYLSLTDTNSGSNNSANLATGNVSALTAAGAYDYGNGFTSAQTTNFGSTSYGFYDDYIINIGAGQVDSITSSITLGSSSGISGLSMRLYDYATNGSAAPPADDADCGILLRCIEHDDPRGFRNHGDV